MLLHFPQSVIPQDLSRSRYLRNAVEFATLIAKRLMVLKRKENTPLTFIHCVRDMMHHLTLEKILYSISFIIPGSLFEMLK